MEANCKSAMVMPEFIDPYYLAKHIAGKVSNYISDQFEK
jgi:hypothetical protein